MVSYVKKEDNFGEDEIRPIRKDEVKKFRPNLKHNQPMPGADDTKIFEWVKTLCTESYEYKKEMHNVWYSNLLDYYTMSSTSTKQKAGRNVGVDGDQDTEIPVPALIKRYVDLGAFWLTREIFKVEPFMQFTTYSNDEEIRKAQKLYERKLQGDTETYGARERCTQLGIDMFLYGNAVAKANFSQDRMVVMEAPEITLNENSVDDDTDPIDYSPETEDLMPEITVGESEPRFEIIDQYAEYTAVFLGHFILDPYAPNRDWRRANYMGDIEYISSEQVIERFGAIPGFMKKFNNLPARKGNLNFGQMPHVGMGDPFLKSWCSFYNTSAPTGLSNSRKMHVVTHLYTKYTETCVLDDSIVVYHKYRNIKVKNMGIYPYVLFKMPTPNGGLFATGYGHFLRNLQLEQTIMASKRLELVGSLGGIMVEYMGDAVDGDKLKKSTSVDGVTFLEVDTPGAIHRIEPNPALMNSYMDAESRNFERAREYVNVPGMLDSSNTKTHLGAVGQRMEAAQVQFDAILESVRSNYKALFHKIHVLNMAYLEGDMDIKGSTNLFNKEFTENVLTADQLKALASQPDLSIELNIGVDMNADKMKSFSALMNTPLVAQVLQQVQASGQMPPENNIKLLGMLFDLAGLTDFRAVFNLDGSTPPPTPPMGMGGMPPQAPPGMEGAPPPQGMPPGMAPGAGEAPMMPPMM